MVETHQIRHSTGALAPALTQTGSGAAAPPPLDVVLRSPEGSTPSPSELVVVAVSLQQGPANYGLWANLAYHLFMYIPQLSMGFTSLNGWGKNLKNNNIL